MAHRRQTELYEYLRNQLVDARLARGIKQTELANLLNQHQSYISNYERGQRRLDLVELVDIAIALKIDVLKLVAGYLDRRNRQ